MKWNGSATGWAQNWSSIYFSDTFVCVDNPLNYYMNMGLNGDANLFIGRPPANSTVMLPTGQWAHVAMTVVPGGKTSLYLDGALIAQTNSDTRTTQGFNEHFLGGNFWDQNFNGAMDDFLMHSRALTEEEIAALAAAQ